MLHFIKSIKIVNLLNIKNELIKLDPEHIKHLAIIGKNNGGKTLLLDNLQKFLDSIRNNHICFLEDWLDEREELLQTKQILDNKLKFADASSTLNLIKMQQNITDITLGELQSKLMQYRVDTLYCTFNRPDVLYNDFISNKILLIYFTENRNFIANTDEHDGYYKEFITYIVELKKQCFKAPEPEYTSRSHDNIKKQNLLVWLNLFERCFVEIIVDYNLQLNWNAENEEFILVDNKANKKHSLLELSKGHLAILGIVSRIIAKAREVSMEPHEIKGLVLIDEIELHLDINLQEKVLSFLTQLFTGVQFIVSSHNIAVLNHVDNFVAFQL